MHINDTINTQDKTRLQDPSQNTSQGTIVAAYGKRFQVELTEGKSRISCVTRGKKTDLACGDAVMIKLTDKHEL